MFINKIGNQYTNALISSSITLGVVLTAGTTPAQAIVAGGLAWDEGTANFLSGVPENPSGDETFDVSFLNPQFPSPITFISGTSGQFEDLFDLGETPLDFVPQGTFKATGIPFVGVDEYELTNDLVWSFSENNVTFTLEEGAKFFVFFEENGSVEVSLETGTGEWSIPGEGILSANNIEFTFGQIPTQDFGGYQASADKGVPEPGTVVGLLAVGGLGLLTKRKKQA